MTKDNKNLPMVNERIPGSKVQLIGSSGENVGLISKFEAIRQAQEEGLELVMLAERGPEGFPVAKIMDFGKALYAKKKKVAEAKKKQKVIKVKEIKIRPSIGEHDLRTKINQSVEFLKEGMRIKLTLVFKGREASSRADVGPQLFKRFEDLLIDTGIEDLAFENESKTGLFWSKIYFVK